MARSSHLVGLGNATVRSRVAFLRESLKVLRNPEAFSADPITYGQHLQRIYDGFTVWGREKTLDDKNIQDHLGRIQLDDLARHYEEWSAR